MDNADKILEKIEKENIKPIPRWRFIWKENLIWLSYVLFILIGAASFSVILYAIQQSEFELLHHSGHSPAEFLLVFFPLLWFGILLVFLGGSILSAVKSFRGYKLGFPRWIGYSTLISMVLGTLFFIYGGAQWFEQTFANQVELYESVQEKKIKIWSNPEEGFLSGQIIAVQSDSIRLEDYNHHIWDIDIRSAFIAPRVLLETGEYIKLNGSMESPDKFRATDLRPWGKNNGKQKKHGKVKEF